ncbi:MAG TPA: hypothetical protein VI386_18715, partial [Candidatus Sulfotelmatobacter sp.]
MSIPSADTLENVFLDTMLSTSDVKGNSVAIEPNKNWLHGWMLALLLIVAGLLIGWYFPNHRLVSMTADALMVAGILALTVDYFLKRDLLTEASRGIFVHLLGFEHHPEVKEKLKQIVFDTKILRAQCRLVVTVEPRQEDSFALTVEYESDIVNSTATPVDFQPFAEWDAAHQPQYLRMQFTSSDGKVAWTETNLALAESEPGVLLAKPHKVTLQPQSKGVTYHGSGTYKIISKHGYFMTHMGLPTLDFSIRVNIPDEYEVAASRSDVHT